MLEMLLAASVWLTSIPPPLGPVLCDYYSYETPTEIKKVLEREGTGVIEIWEKEPSGLITSLFVVWFHKYLLLEGMFIESGDGVAVCYIRSAKEIDEDDGHILFEWPK